MTVQPYDNRIDCGRLSIKSKWDIVITSTIPLDPISGEIVQMRSDLSIITAGNLGPPYFI